MTGGPRFDLDAGLPKKPKFRVEVSGVLLGVALAVYSVFTDFDLLGSKGYLRIFINIALSALVALICLVFAYLYRIVMYSRNIDIEAKLLLDYAKSNKTRLESTAAALAGFRNTSDLIGIEKIGKGNNSIIITLEKSPNLSIGDYVSIVDQDQSLITGFIVDQERTNFWLASSTSKTDGLWLGYMLSVDQPPLHPHAIAIKG